MFRRLRQPKVESHPLDRNALAAYVRGYAAPSKYAQDYIEIHLGRLVRTIQLTPPGGPADRVLDMGCYVHITPALKFRLGYGEVRGSYLGQLGVVDEKEAISTSGETFSCKIDLFNAEKDRYPYPDGHFTTVICCELLEHLEVDPMHLASEVNRILRPGGHFILSTPNICSLRSIAAVIAGGHPGLFPEYITPLPGVDTNRHSREYTPSEIRQLMDDAGFTVERMETSPQGLNEPSGYEWVADILKRRGAPTGLRDDTIHAVARKTGAVKHRYPTWLYV